MSVCECVCVWVCLCGCVCVFAAALCGVLVAHSWGLSAARNARAGARFVLRFWHRPVAARLAAGITWTNPTPSAPWGSRVEHTSVIDAAGAIYVLGGYSYMNRTETFYHDVWQSTDRGADRTRARNGCVEYPRGYQGGTKWYEG